MKLDFLLNENKLRPMKEIFGQWEYQIPASPERLLYDFYFLGWLDSAIHTKLATDVTVFENLETLAYQIHEAYEQIVDTLKPHMIKAVGFCLSAELRHLFDNMSQFRQEYEAGTLKIRPETLKFVETYAHYLGKHLTKAGEPETYPEIPNEDISGVYRKGFLAKQGNDERKMSYKAVLKTIRALKIKAYDFGMICDDAFRNVKWGGSYGGPKWADIGVAYAKLAAAQTLHDKAVWLDHVYDLQHNTDVVFNKLKFYYSGGYEWLKRALNWKADVTDMRDYYQRVSSSLKPLVAYAAKNITRQGAMEGAKENDFHPAFKGMGEAIAWDRDGKLGKSEVEMDKLSVGPHDIYMSSCPLYKPPGGDVETYLKQWLEYSRDIGIRTIVCLLPDVDQLIKIYKMFGFSVIHYPIKDFGVPQDMNSFYKFIQQTIEALAKGNVLVHCMGGYGRTGLVAACLMVMKGLDPDTAIKTVRQARKHTLETKEQEGFVEDFAIFVDKLKSV